MTADLDASGSRGLPHKSGFGSLVAAAVAYMSIVFICGFLLGTVRTLWLAPRVGEVSAALLEAPIMLVISWSICTKVIRALHVEATAKARISMGSLAFASLLLVEHGVSRIVFHRELQVELAEYATARGLIGLLAQSVFALMPLLQLKGSGAADG